MLSWWLRRLEEVLLNEISPSITPNVPGAEPSILPPVLHPKSDSFYTSNHFRLRHLSFSSPSSKPSHFFFLLWNHQLSLAAEPCLLSPSLKYWLDWTPWDLWDYGDTEQTSYLGACAWMNLCRLFIGLHECEIVICDAPPGRRWIDISPLEVITSGLNTTQWQRLLSLILFIYFICHWEKKKEPLSVRDHKVEINGRL